MIIIIIIIVSKRKSGFIQFQSFSSSSEKRYHNSYQLPPKQKLHHSCLVKTKLITTITQHIFLRRTARDCERKFHHSFSYLIKFIISYISLKCVYCTYIIVTYTTVQRYNMYFMLIKWCSTLLPKKHFSNFHISIIHHEILYTYYVLFCRT